jgi:hypothetical protein
MDICNTVEDIITALILCLTSGQHLLINVLHVPTGNYKEEEKKDDSAPTDNHKEEEGEEEGGGVCVGGGDTATAPSRCHPHL